MASHGRNADRDTDPPSPEQCMRCERGSRRHFGIAEGAGMPRGKVCVGSQTSHLPPDSVGGEWVSD
eukprot:1131808-Pleurochrysis_carterae.AAC.1